MHYKKFFTLWIIALSVYQICANLLKVFIMPDEKPIALCAEASGEAWKNYIGIDKSSPPLMLNQWIMQYDSFDLFVRSLVPTQTKHGNCSLWRDVINMNQHISFGNCC